MCAATAVDVNIHTLQKGITMTGIMEFSKAVFEQTAPPPLPSGDYPAEIVNSEIKTSTSSGNNYLALTFLIHPNDYPADFIEGDMDGTKLSYNRLVMTDTPRSRWMLRQFCEAVGAAVPSTTFDPTDLMGIRAMVTVTHQEYEGEQRAQISRVSGA